MHGSWGRSDGNHKVRTLPDGTGTVPLKSALVLFMKLSAVDLAVVVQTATNVLNPSTKPPCFRVIRRHTALYAQC